MDFTEYVNQTRGLFLPLLASGSEDIAALTSAAATTHDALRNLPIELQAKLTPLLDRTWQGLLSTYQLADSRDIDWENEWHREFLSMTQEWLLLLPTS